MFIAYALLGMLLYAGLKYVITGILNKDNLKPTLSNLLSDAKTELAKEAMASGFRAMVQKKKGNTVTLDVITSKAQRFDIRITADAIEENIYEGLTV